MSATVGWSNAFDFHYKKGAQYKSRLNLVFDTRLADNMVRITVI